MNRIFQIIAGILFLLLVTAITLAFLINDLTEKSFYEESGNVSVTGINSNVNISKDRYGVPTITSGNEHDLYFAMGYIHAQDRLWQMDLSRRVAEGRLSEIMGADVLEYDKLFRTLAIDNTADGLYNMVSSKTKELLIAYSAGVNAFIENNNDRLPLEFDVLNYKPDKWTPQHSLMIVRLMGWELNTAWYSDYVLGVIAERFGLERAADFIPDYPKNAPVIVRTGKEDTTSVKTDTIPAVQDTSISSYKLTGFKDYASGFFESITNYRKDFNSEGTTIGSNSWVISGRKTESGKPILANDPHLSLQVPSKWYELTLKTGTSIVSGSSIPGAPTIVIGTNGKISWGITNLMNDDTDFYFLPVTDGKYKLGDTALSIDSTVQYIKIKDQTDELAYTSYRTALGPVVSGLNKTGFRTKQKFPPVSDRLLAIRWSGYDFSDEILCFYNINKASGWDEFRNALKDMGVPGSNFVYADVNGNIGYQAAGKVPIRGNVTNQFLPMLPGNGDMYWNGYEPFDKMPSIYNPESGYIVTANNKVTDNTDIYISNLWMPFYRAKRISNFLSSRTFVSIEDVELLQNDVYSIQSEEYLKILFDSFLDSSDNKQGYEEHINLLKKWDKNMTSSSPAAAIYAYFEAEIYKNTYLVHLDEEIFENYMYVKALPVRNTEKLFREKKSFLIPGGDKEKGVKQLVKKSFYEAIDALKIRYGDNTNGWVWGEHHSLTIPHPLGSVPALSSVLNIGPSDVSGSGTTISNMEYSLSNVLRTGKFDIQVGPSMRFITDMSQPHIIYSINSTGQSGQPLHKNYRDQTRIWLNSEYRVTNLQNTAFESVLVLEPR